MSKKKKYTANIKGVNWDFYCIPQSSYIRAHGKDSDAVTYPHDKECYFNKARFLPGAVRHEIFHIYVASSGINSANLTVDQMEELGAELYEQHGPSMDVLVDNILDFFMR